MRRRCPARPAQKGKERAGGIPSCPRQGLHPLHPRKVSLQALLEFQNGAEALRAKISLIREICGEKTGKPWVTPLDRLTFCVQWSRIKTTTHLLRNTPDTACGLLPGLPKSFNAKRRQSCHRKQNTAEWRRGFPAFHEGIVPVLPVFCSAHAEMTGRPSGRYNAAGESDERNTQGLCSSHFKT